MNVWASQVQNWARTQPNQTSFLDARIAITYHELNQTSQLVQLHMAQLDVRSSDRIILAVPRSPALMTLMTAALSLDLPTLTVDRGQIETTLTRLTHLLKPRIILIMKTDLEMVSRLGLMADFQVHEFEVGINFSDPIVALIGKRSLGEHVPNDLAWLLQTSGSTREPRIAMISRRNLEERARGEIRDFEITSQDTLLNTLSVCHDLGLNQFLTTLLAGNTLFIQSQPFASATVRELGTRLITGITGTPLMWTQFLSAQPAIYPEVRYITVSGGSLPTSELKSLTRIFPQARVLRTYGQTETFRSLLSREIDDLSTGTPIANVKLQIMHENGNECSVGEIGELLHQGEGSMLGYFGLINETHDKISEQGIRTGDLFYRDTENHFYFSGRRDDMKKRFDTRLHLQEIEMTVQELPFVRDAVVVAKPSAHDDLRQTLLCVFVQLTANHAGLAQVDVEQEVIEHCKRELAPYKIPDAVQCLETFPQTPSYKVDRILLTKIWTAETENRRHYR